MPIVIILQMSKQSPRGLSHFVRIHLEMLERAEAPLTSEAHPLSSNVFSHSSGLSWAVVNPTCGSVVACPEPPGAGAPPWWWQHAPPPGSRSLLRPRRMGPACGGLAVLGTRITCQRRCRARGRDHVISLVCF